MNANAPRTLRLAPRDVMTGDLLIEREAYTGRTVEDVVTFVEQSEDKRTWKITTVERAARYAAQRRISVKRSGPKGLGE